MMGSTMTNATTKTVTVGTKTHARMVRRYERMWLAAVRREEDADTLDASWKLAAESDRARATLEMVRAGFVPVRRVPRTKRNMAIGAFQALATIGRIVHRAMAKARGIAKAQAVLAAKRVAKRVSNACRVAVRAVAMAAMLRGVSPVVAVAAPVKAVQMVTVSGRTYNRVPERSRTVDVTFEAPANAPLLTILELAYKAGAPKGARTAFGVFQVQTDAGMWDTAAGTKLMTVSHSSLSPAVRFRTWDEVEASE
jgi:hypothetical protein